MLAEPVHNLVIEIGQAQETDVATSLRASAEARALLQFVYARSGLVCRLPQISEGGG